VFDPNSGMNRKGKGKKVSWSTMSSLLIICMTKRYTFKPGDKITKYLQGC
jgi:hypothetical protein